MYTIDRLYDNIHVASEETPENDIVVFNHPSYVYKLNQNITPFWSYY